MFIDYRWHDAESLDLLFPFGHGLGSRLELSETKPDRQSLRACETLTVKVAVRSLGARAGAEVVQIYVADVTASAPRPERELKGFAKLVSPPAKRVSPSSRSCRGSSPSGRRDAFPAVGKAYAAVRPW